MPPESYCPFSTIKYKLNSDNDHLFFVSKVDAINEPTLVIPTSLKEEDFQLQTDIRLRKNITFTNIPFGFINRDGWDPQTNLGLIEFNKCFKKLPFISQYWDRNLDPLYQELKETLKSNGRGDRVLEDAQAIEEYEDENMRYLLVILTLILTYNYHKVRIHMLEIKVSRFVSSRSFESIGNGLFATRNLPEGTFISWFRGVITSVAQYMERRAEGKGGYGIKVKGNQILDCYDYCKQRQCWASFSNCPLNIVDTAPDGVEKQDCSRPNAKLVITGYRAYLISSVPIHIGQEVLWKYGNSYGY